MQGLRFLNLDVIQICCGGLVGHVVQSLPKLRKEGLFINVEGNLTSEEKIIIEGFEDCGNVEQDQDEHNDEADDEGKENEEHGERGEAESDGEQDDDNNNNEKVDVEPWEASSKDENREILSNCGVNVYTTNTGETIVWTYMGRYGCCGFSTFSY